MLHEVEHVLWSLRNPGIEASIRAWNLIFRLELVVDQPEAVLTVPQRKGLVAKPTTDARYRGLFRPISPVVPPHLKIGWAEAVYVSRAAVDLAARSSWHLPIM